MVDETTDAWAPWTPAAPPDATAHDLFRRELDRCHRGATEGTHLRLAAFDRAGRMVGLFALNEIVAGVFQSAYASWQVRTSEVGNGFGTEGARALLEIAFSAWPDGLGLHRVQANVMPSNEASLRIADKLGLRREGLAERYLQIAGSWQDHVMLAITREEWA